MVRFMEGEILKLYASVSGILGSDRFYGHFPSSTMSRDSSATSTAAKATKYYLGELQEGACLSTEELQVNHANESEQRFPTAIACLPSSKILLVGFDSGEIQTYTGLDSETGMTAGPCFRISEDNPVLFIKVQEGWNPFNQELLRSPRGLSSKPESWSVRVQF